MVPTILHSSLFKIKICLIQHLEIKVILALNMGFQLVFVGKLQMEIISLMVLIFLMVLNLFLVSLNLIHLQILHFLTLSMIQTDILIVVPLIMSYLVVMVYCNKMTIMVQENWLLAVEKDWRLQILVIH